MIKITDKSKCCGCTACSSICPHNAIYMQPDTLGFLYPVVDESKCTDCGLCEKVCSFNDHYDTSLNFQQPYAYGARHKDMHEVETSRSGAAFIAISDYVLEQGGVVYGVGYTDHFRVVHKRAVTKEERDEFKGSKYVQSDLTGIFRQVKQDLKSNLLVLFSGTPCQTSGLASYLGEKLRDKIILVDIVCHGVPGPYVWRDYLAYLEKKHGDEIYYVNFRDKSRFGWKAHQETYKFMSGEWIFTNVFYKHITFRQSCGVCPYTNTRRPSDITIADFWGWEKTDPDINADDKGVSLILINTEKGKMVFDQVKDKMNVVPARLEDCLQTHLKKPLELHPEREAFEKDYERMGFEWTIKHYGIIGWRKQIMAFSRLLKNISARIVHSIMK